MSQKLVSKLFSMSEIKVVVMHIVIQTLPTMFFPVKLKHSMVGRWGTAQLWLQRSFMQPVVPVNWPLIFFLLGGHTHSCGSLHVSKTLANLHSDNVQDWRQPCGVGKEWKKDDSAAGFLQPQYGPLWPHCGLSGRPCSKENIPVFGNMSCCSFVMEENNCSVNDTLMILCFLWLNTLVVNF